MSDDLKVLLGALGGAVLVLLLVSLLGGGGMMGGMGSMMSGGIMGGGLLDVHVPRRRDVTPSHTIGRLEVAGKDVRLGS